MPYRLSSIVPPFLLLAGLFLSFPDLQAQPLTGTWRGKVSVKEGLLNRSVALELQWELEGDSLRGRAYYYQNRTRYAVTRIAGSVDPRDGTVRWQDQEILEGTWNPPGKGELQFTADFNCPGEGIMKLDGSVATMSRDESPAGQVHLDKVETPLFPEPGPTPAPAPVVVQAAPVPSKPASTPAKQPVPGEKPAPKAANHTPPAVTPPPVTTPASTPTEPVLTVAKPVQVEDLYRQRQRQLVTTIPVWGDSLEINFYDHAEIDGDSISLFVNGKLLKDHILLKATPYTFKFALADLQPETELTMVAENLGRIPPNTSLMIAYVNGVRHEARLESTENSSAMIRFVKSAPASGQAQAGQRRP